MRPANVTVPHVVRSKISFAVEYAKISLLASNSSMCEIEQTLPVEVRHTAAA